MTGTFRTFVFAIAAVWLPATNAAGVSLEPYKETCSSIGFKLGTPKHGSCVIELFGRDRDDAKNKQEKLRDQADSRRLQRIERLNQQQLIEAQKLAREAKSMRQLQGLETAIQGFNMMSGSKSSSSSSGSQSTGYLKRQWVSGHNRVCVYSSSSGDFTHNTDAASICPISLP